MDTKINLDMRVLKYIMLESDEINIPNEREKKFFETANVAGKSSLLFFLCHMEREEQEEEKNR